MLLIYYFVNNRRYSLTFILLMATSPQRPPLYNGHFFWQTVHTFALVSTSLQGGATFFCPQGGHCERFNCIQKGYFFYEKGKRLDLGAQPPRMQRLWVPREEYEGKEASVSSEHSRMRSLWFSFWNETLILILKFHLNVNWKWTFFWDENCEPKKGVAWGERGMRTVFKMIWCDGRYQNNALNISKFLNAVQASFSNKTHSGMKVM